MNESAIITSLIEKELAGCYNLIEKEVIDSESLRQFLQILLEYSSTYSVDPIHPISHPILALNSIKNLLAIRKEKPSIPLLKLAVKILDDSSHKKKVTLLPMNEIIPPSQPIFIMDFLDAIESGDKDQAILEAQKILSTSENKSYLMELLVLESLDYFEHLGPVVTSFYRASSFCMSDKIPQFISPLIDLFLEWINRKLFSEGGSVKENDFQSTEKSVLDASLYAIVYYAFCHRIWNIASVLQKPIRQKLNPWMKSDNFSEFDKEELITNGNGEINVDQFLHYLKINNSDETVFFLKNFKETKEREWALRIAEYWIENEITNSPLHFVALESAEYLLRQPDVNGIRKMNEFLNNIVR